MSRWLPVAFPFGTMAVNLAACLVLGLLAGWSAGRAGLHSAAGLFLAVGFCGGFSTFSTFTFENMEMLKAGQWGWAAANVLLSAALCLGALWGGLALSKFT